MSYQVQDEQYGQLLFEHGRNETTFSAWATALHESGRARLQFQVRRAGDRTCGDHVFLERDEARTLAQVLFHFANTGRLEPPQDIERLWNGCQSPPREDVFLAEDGVTRLGPVLYAQRQGDLGYETVSAKEALHFAPIAQGARDIAYFVAEHLQHFRTGQQVLGLDHGQVQLSRLLLALAHRLADAEIIERPEWMQEDAP